MASIPRESTEYVFFTVSVDNVPVTAGVQVAVVGEYDRPTGWAPAALVNGKTAVLITGRQPGSYRLWTKVANGVETIVDDGGRFVID